MSLQKKVIPVFDLGNVVIQVDFRPFFAWLTQRSASPDPEASRAVVESALWNDFECGRLSRADFAAGLRSRYQAQFTLPELEERFCAIFPGPVPGMPDLLAEFAAAGPVYALSNTNEIHLSYLRSQFPALLRPFRHIFASQELGLRKPFPEIYQRAAQHLGVSPRDLVFFDDLPANVIGASNAGLIAHLFTEAGEVQRILKRKGVLGDNGGHGENRL